MMNIKRTATLLLFLIAPITNSIEFEKGLSQQQEMPSSLEGLKEYYLSNSLPENSIAYIENGRAEHSYYTLNNKAVVFDADLIPKTPQSFFVDETIISSWPLTRWQYEFLNQQYLDDYSRVGLMNASEAFPIRILSEYEREDNIGCLSSTPLRYGDVDNDGQNELVLTAGEDLIVFSPEYERIIFMQRYNLLGWLSKEKSVLFLTENIDTDRTEEPQYLSHIGATTIEDYQFIAPGIRGYAKVYEGDFDEDSHSDILVWAKTYQSNMNGEKEGFFIVENKFIHYERDLEAQNKSESGITGEYIPQETNEATIQLWLSEHELTWSKGFPSISECAGEEGELISEMHDVLLNDPDVLQ